MGKTTVVMTPLELEFCPGATDPMPFIQPGDLSKRTKDAIEQTLDNHVGDKISNIELVEGICNADPEFVFLNGIMHVAKLLKENENVVKMQIMAHELRKRFTDGL